jgi:TonB family protein
LQGNQGREYRLIVGSLAGTAHVYATSRRFYAIVYLNTKKDEALQDQFLSSFAIPEKILPMTATVVADPSLVPTGRAGVAATTAEGNAAATKEPSDGNEKTESPPPDAIGANATGEAKPKRAPISGGVLNGKAIYLPKPEYPAEAHAAGASGTVVIQVTIDESGMVSAATAVSGHQLLRQAATNAALQARFSATTLMGEPVKVTGVITYNFVRQ